MASGSEEVHAAKIQRIEQIVLDHLGVPRPGITTEVAELQNRLLPAFMDRSRHAWLAGSPMELPSDRSSWPYLADETERAASDIDRLNSILEAMGVHDLLQDVSEAPEARAMADMPIDPLDMRILRAAGHPDSASVLRRVLQAVAADPRILAASERKLNSASKAALGAHRDINSLLQPTPPVSPAAPAPIEKPRRQKLFTGTGKLFAGLALISGNALLVQNVPFSPAAIPVLTSLTGGFGMLTEGIGQLRREGE